LNAIGLLQKGVKCRFYMWENEYEAFLREIGVLNMQNNVKYEISDIENEGVVMKKGNAELLALVDDVKFLIVIIVIVMISMLVVMLCK
jgi:hypothetical protein